MNKKIYVVTSGKYSDYGIDGVFDDKELAQSFIDSFKGVRDVYYGDDDKMRIEEYDFNGGEYRKGLKLYFIRFKPNSSDIDTINAVSHLYTGDCGSMSVDGVFSTVAWGKDGEHAAKVANEKRAMYLANNPQ